MSIQKSYNALSLQGLEFDDMEFVEQYKLDPRLAYTPKINFAMLDNIYHKNIDNFIKDGMTRDKASVKAGRIRAKYKANIMDLVKQVK